MKKVLLLSLSIALFSGCKKTDKKEVAPDAVSSEQPPASASGAQIFTRKQPGATKDDASLLAPLSEDDKSKFEAWFKTHHLDPNDAVAMDQDPDGDGYSNREEFLADTNPHESASVPGTLTGTKLKEFTDVKVPIILREVKDGKARVERTDGSGTQETLKEGSTPKGLAYKVTSVKYDVKPDKHGVVTDMSQVILESEETKDKLTLVRDMPARSSQSTATIVDVDGTEKQLHFDETFTLTSQPGKTFRVIDLRNDQVVIQDVGTKQTLTIGK